jgi:hypothetical protein
MPMKVKIKRRKTRMSGLIEALRKEQMKHAKKASALYRSSIDGWQEGPTFAVQQMDADPLRLNIYARGAKDIVNRYSWIDGGFLRRVAMETGFIAKSTPGSLVQGPGRGGLSTNASGYPTMLPVPKPVVRRKFTKSVADGIRSEYFTGMMAVFKRHVRKRT